MKYGLNALYERRSVRKYKSEQISDGELEQILKAGLCAPSAMNRQQANYNRRAGQGHDSIYVKAQRAGHGVKRRPFYGAPTVLVVLAEADNINAVKDGSLVLGNLMNAASALGIGSCWVNRAEEVFASEEGKALLEKWGVQGDYIGVGNCILGYPAETPAAKPIKRKPPLLCTVTHIEYLRF